MMTFGSLRETALSKHERTGKKKKRGGPSQRLARPRSEAKRGLMIFARSFVAVFFGGPHFVQRSEKLRGKGKKKGDRGKGEI